MKNHTKVYLKEMGFSTTDWIPCEVCRATAVDIHHIESRGMGGSKTADTIENLMALCRECHVEFGDKKHYKELLVATHAMRMSNL
jgi:5-methylcytosine-specific restriction endonuclease McrA